MCFQIQYNWSYIEIVKFSTSHLDMSIYLNLYLILAKVKALKKVMVEDLACIIQTQTNKIYCICCV